MPSDSASRPRGRDKDKVAKKDIEECHERLDQHRDRLTRASQLSLLASRDAGELKAGLQLVLFLTGMAQLAVKAVLQEYEGQKQAVISGNQAKGAPLKNRVYSKIVHLLNEKATSSFPSAVGAMNKIAQYDDTYCINSIAGLAKMPSEEDGKPWLLILTFTSTPGGRALRDLWADPSLPQMFVKQAGAWPELTVKPGQWKASRLFQEVCLDVG